MTQVPVSDQFELKPFDFDRLHRIDTTTDIVAMLIFVLQKSGMLIKSKSSPKGKRWTITYRDITCNTKGDAKKLKLKVNLGEPLSRPVKIYRQSVSSPSALGTILFTLVAELGVPYNWDANVLTINDSEIHIAPKPYKRY